MMSILEYANDMNLSKKDVMKLCEDLGIVFQDENTVLTEDDIIMLDNMVDTEDSDVQTDDVVETDEEYEEPVKENKAFYNEPKVEKKYYAKEEKEDKDAYFKKRKKAYKNKEKLQSNVDQEGLVFKEGMSVQEFGNLIGKTPVDILQKTLELGSVININSALSYDVASLIASEFGFSIVQEKKVDISDFENLEIIDKEEDLVKRPPVITIMGHVDHGKTTLLDAIRSSKITEGEAGGITQGIDSYQVTYKGEKMTFIDTPGHEAFTDMRSRGAQITDIIIIIVAADDGVNAQTEEAIDHAKASGVPIIVAINKIDKPDINIEKVMSEITNAGLMPEEYGGDVIVSKISAKEHIGIDELLDSLLLVSEMEDLKANPNRYALGTVIEAKKDDKVGTIATILVQNGTLRLGDPIVVGNISGKIRTMTDDLGKALTEAEPSTPVSITGLSEVPEAGDKFMAFETEKESKAVAQERSRKEEDVVASPMSLEDLFKDFNSDNKVLNMLIKADVKGSLEAIKDSVMKMNVEGTTINIIRGGVGAISESDILLASASNAIIFGFNVIASAQARELAKMRKIDIRLYDVIYKLLEDLEKGLKGMLDPVFEEEIIGSVEILKIFKFSKVGNIAGCKVLDGNIKRSSKIKLSRDGKIIYQGELDSLKKEDKSVNQVSKGEECGLTIKDYQDIKEGDIIEAYELKEKKL